MASIDKRSGGYRIRVYRTDANGKRVNATMTYVPKEKSPSKIEKEVQKVALDFEKRVKDGLYYDGEKMTFAQYAPIWREQWAVNNLTQRGLESYEDALRLRVVPAIGNIAIGQIRPTHIQSIVADMIKKEYAPKTIKRTLSAINSVMRYAYDMEVIQNNPCDRVHAPKETQNNELHYFTDEQTNRFFDALERRYPCVRKGHASKSPKTGKTFNVKEYTQYTEIPFQWRVYFNLAIYGGFRRGELCGLKWSDIDFEERTLSITRAVTKTKDGQIIKEPKTKSGIRTVKLPETTINILREWYTKQKEYSLKLGTLWKGKTGKQFDDNYIFIQLDSGLMMSVDTPSHKFKEIIDMYNRMCENEEEKLPSIRLHDLRHTSATLLISNGVDISTVSHRLGHSQTSVTLNVYSHWMEEKDEKASEVLERVLQKKA